MSKPRTAAQRAARARYQRELRAAEKHGQRLRQDVGFYASEVAEMLRREANVDASTARAIVDAWSAWIRRMHNLADLGALSPMAAAKTIAAFHRRHGVAPGDGVHWSDVQRPAHEEYWTARGVDPHGGLESGNFPQRSAANRATQRSKKTTLPRAP